MHTAGPGIDLGHHWAVRREAGESQLTYNWVRAFSDFLTNWSFGRGITFRSPRATSAIVPSLLNRVWTVDNDRASVLWGMGNMGSVSGDCFVKVAYQEPVMYPPAPVPPGVRQRFLPGRVRIMPLNSSFCFPEFAPHDRERMIRFKQKYRFWGTTPEGTRSVFCVDTATEALTKRGWVTHDDLTQDDEVLAIDPVTKVIRWEPVISVHEFDWDGPLTRWKSKSVDAFTTPDHRWLVHGTGGLDWRTTATVRPSHDVLVGGGTPFCFANSPVYSDEFVELLGWVITEGHYQHDSNGTRLGGVMVRQTDVNPDHQQRIRDLVKHFSDQGATCTEYGSGGFYFGRGIGSLIRQASPDKQLTPDFLCSLTEHQASLLYQTVIDADGWRNGNTDYFGQRDKGRVDSFQMLCSMLGYKTTARPKGDDFTVVGISKHKGKYFTPGRTPDSVTTEHYKGTVWCPRTPSMTWLARRNGSVYWTGNTYTELITDLSIEEYVNDNLIAPPRPNPLGQIPVVHIANRKVEGSPWGLSDTEQILTQNRTYNELSTQILDILDYYVAPVTVITGGKLQSMERGARKMWAFPNDKAEVHNLEGGVAGLEAAHEMRASLLADMHALVGVPQGALGAMQAISNTSGVALAINYLPTTAVHNHKKMTYGRGLQIINELVLRTLAQKEPETGFWSPEIDEELKDGQLGELDWDDPVTYRTEPVWPPPLPTDAAAKLMELQQKAIMGIASKRDMLEELGEEFPDTKLAEIIDELKTDAEDQGALDLIRATIAMVVQEQTGMVPGAPGEPPQPTAVAQAGGEGVNSGGTPASSSPDASGAFPLGGMLPPPGMDQMQFRRIQQAVNQRAYGTNPGRQRLPDGGGN